MHTHCTILLAPFLAAGLTAQSPLQWRVLPQRAVPSAAAWDSARQTTVIVTSDAGLRQFEWNGADLRERRQALLGFTHFGWLADDPNRGELVTLLTGPVRVGRFDGARWNWTQAPTSPAINGLVRAAYDPERGRLVAVQGESNQLDVHEWDGAQWWSFPGLPGPGPRLEAAFAWSPLHRRCVLYGGSNNGTALGDCWSWDGSAWTQLAANAPPGPRIAAALAADAQGRLVLYGGSAATTTWRLLGSTWSLLPTAHDPGPRAYPTLVRDPLGLLLVGGSSTDGTAHRFDGVDWVATGIPFARPSNLATGIAAYDRARGQCVLLQGTGSTQALTWTFDDAWRAANPSQSPPARNGGHLCWSAIDQQVLLFGGVDGTGTEFGDTWSWTGTDWQLRTPVHAPSPRHLGKVAADPRGGVLLLGGFSGLNLLTDPWYWDGTDWQAVTTPTPAIAVLTMTVLGFDPGRNRTVLVGLAGQQIETHEWDGAAWAPAATMPITAPLLGRPISYEPRLQALVTLGNPAMAWNGSTWTNLGTSTHGPPTGTPQFLLTDHARQRLLVLAGTTGPSVAVASTRVADSAAYGAGCARGPSPALAAIADPVPGNAAFAIDLGTLAPGAPVFLVLGFGEQFQPIGSGCASLVALPLATAFATAGTGATARFPLPLPNAAGLLGVQVTAQGAVWDPARSLLGTVTLTAGLRVTIGE